MSIFGVFVTVTLSAFALYVVIPIVTGIIRGIRDGTFYDDRYR